jgi:hypothetical protein
MMNKLINWMKNMRNLFDLNCGISGRSTFDCTAESFHVAYSTSANFSSFARFSAHKVPAHNLAGTLCIQRSWTIWVKRSTSAKAAPPEETSQDFQKACRNSSVFWYEAGWRFPSWTTQKVFQNSTNKPVNGDNVDSRFTHSPPFMDFQCSNM